MSWLEKSKGVPSQEGHVVVSVKHSSHPFAFDLLGCVLQAPRPSQLQEMLQQLRSPRRRKAMSRWLKGSWDWLVSACCYCVFFFTFFYYNQHYSPSMEKVLDWRRHAVLEMEAERRWILWFLISLPFSSKNTSSIEKFQLESVTSLVLFESFYSFHCSVRSEQDVGQVHSILCSIIQSLAILNGIILEKHCESTYILNTTQNAINEIQEFNCDMWVILGGGGVLMCHPACQQGVLKV